MAVFDLWSIQYHYTKSYQNPKDIDIRFKSNTFFDVEFEGIIGAQNNFCNPEEWQFHTYNSNNGNPLPYTYWRPFSWLTDPPTLQAGFIVKKYKVIEYNDANRSNIIQQINGNIDIYDQYLIDEHGWYESLLIEHTQNITVPIQTSVNLYCKILQPCRSILTVTSKKLPSGNEIQLLNQQYDDLLRYKEVNVAHTFTSFGQYLIKWQLVTPKTQNRGWCGEPENDFIDLKTAVITVGDN